MSKLRSVILYLLPALPFIGMFAGYVVSNRKSIAEYRQTHREILDFCTKYELPPCPHNCYVMPIPCTERLAFCVDGEWVLGAGSGTPGKDWKITEWPKACDDAIAFACKAGLKNVPCGEGNPPHAVFESFCADHRPGALRMHPDGIARGEPCPNCGSR